MATDKKKSKQARHERRMTEQQRAKKEATFGLEQITQEQISEMCLQTLAALNIRIQTILETDFPEAVSLMEPDLLQTVKRFSDAGKTEILKQAVAQCNEEREAFVGLALLSWAKTNAHLENSDERVNSLAEWPSADSKEIDFPRLL